MNKLKVELISTTSAPECIVASAAKVCYSSKTSIDTFHNNIKKDNSDYIKKLIKLGHTSVFEHANFTFSISNISRAALMQLTRHRHASFSVRSQRYVKEDNFNYIIPDSIKNSIHKREFVDLMDNIKKVYSKLIKSGIAKEDARAILPSATTSQVIMTMNARSLFNFFKLRTCERAQKEIRDLAWKILTICIKAAPNIFAKAGPSCVFSSCSEGEMYCGKFKEIREKGLKIHKELGSNLK